MSWTLEQAANDLERYVLQGEPPSVDATAMMVAWARMGVIGRPTCEFKPAYEPGGTGKTLLDECSECGWLIEPWYACKFHYCPNCGAKVVE